MHPENTRLINLFQLADSSFPIGGFVFSQGMESAVKGDFLQSNEDVVRYLNTVAEQIISFDFPFIDAAYTYQNQSEHWKEIVQTYEAMLLNPSIYKSSVVLGDNWLKLVRKLYPSPKLEEIFEVFTQEKLAFHQLIIMSLGCAILGVEVSQVREMHVYMLIRDQISALTRIGSVGPLGGQQFMTETLAAIRPKIENYLSVPYQEAEKTAYVLEIIQLNHERIYSKLFQN